MTVSDSFDIGPDAIDVTVASELVHIQDQDVQGISSRLRIPSSYAEGDLNIRTVVVEAKDGSGTIRNICLERSSLDRELEKYVRRVAKIACRNTLNELATKEMVQRNGFTINDQGIVLSAGGETLCCGLFDLAAYEYAGERMLLWTDAIEPAATILESDPNSLTLRHLLPQLIREPSNEADQHLVGVLPCEVGDAASFQAKPVSQRHGIDARYKYILLLIAVVCGSIAAMATHALANAGPINWLVMLPGAVPVCLILGGLAYKELRRKPTELAVFRDGIVIRQNQDAYEFAWSEIESMRITQQNNYDSFQHYTYLSCTTVSIRLKQTSPIGTKIDLSWQNEPSTLTCTEFLKDKCVEFRPEIPPVVPAGDGVAETLMLYL